MRGRRAGQGDGKKEGGMGAWMERRRAGRGVGRRRVQQGIEGWEER
jgi:hypothetical protein